MVNVKPMQKGEKFGMLTILGESTKRGKELFEKCLCDCGKTKFVSRSHLRRGDIRSCGCFAKKSTRERLYKYRIKHGMYNTPIYKIYRGAKYRCNNKNATSYEIYGGRGIRFLWNSFEEFYADMGPSYEEHARIYGERDTTIERIDGDGNYCKENCRWATWKEQNDNRRSNMKIEYNGIEYPSIADLARSFGKPAYLVRGRIKRGWDIDSVIKQPSKRHLYK